MDSSVQFPFSGHLPDTGIELPGKPLDCVDHNKLWKILKEIRIPDHCTCFLGNVHEGQGTAVGIGQGTTNWYKSGKEIHQGCILSPSLFDFCAEYTMESNLLKESEAEKIITVRSMNDLSYKMTTHKWLGNKQTNNSRN